MTRSTTVLLVIFLAALVGRGQYNQVIPRARGEAARIEREAEAYQKEVVARSEGDAKRFLAVYDSYKLAKDAFRTTISRQMLSESLMLTGDENIIDINFVVFWVIKDAGEYLFNIREPGNIKRIVLGEEIGSMISK